MDQSVDANGIDLLDLKYIFIADIIHKQKQ